MHFSVLLFGFTAILGRLITLPATPLVWWRVLIVTTVLCAFPATWRGLRALTGKLLLTYFTIGIVLCLHWLCFYGSVKLANSSIAATKLALASMLVAFIEPLLLHQKIKVAEIILGLLIIPGIMLIAGGTPERMYMGLLLGSLSALFVALVAILNKRYIDQSDAFTMTAIEMFAALVFITFMSPLLPDSESPFVLPRSHDMFLLMILAVFCTALPFILTFKAMRHVTAFGSLLAINMEPVYTIILSIIFFNEQHELSQQFYVGVLIVLFTVFAYPFVHSKINWRQG
jgi:drug/metabolite transporter (DMT)-like permease